MKIKITCRPRYNPWLKKYLNTKTFSKILALGILINSIPINSLAGVLSEDSRYETFEGDNITINNILEEDKVDVEIEGNTMVNVANQKDPVPITKKYTVEGANHIPLQGKYDSKARPVIEGNTMYYNNDTGELSDTFVEGANLSLISSFEDQLVTQEMVNSGQEKAENLGKYKVEYKVTGKNKFYGPVTKMDDWNLISVNYFDCIPNTNYKAGWFNDEQDNAITTSLFFYDKDYNHISTKMGYEDTLSPLNARYMRAMFSTSNTELTEIKGVIFENEYPSKLLYEPYRESIKTFYLNSPLLKGDTIEDIDGKATHIKRRNQIVLNGKENWIRNFFTTSSGDVLRFRINDFLNPTPAINSKLICDSYYGAPGDTPGKEYMRTADSNIYIYKKDITMSLDEFKAQLEVKPVVVSYLMATPQYETISEESILCNSYTNGHLDFNTNIPVNKIDFIPTTTNLNYLYPSTEYTVQFESDNVGKIDRVSLGDEVLYSNYSVNKGVNRFNITTPSTISSTELILDGIGFNLSNLVVTQSSDENFDYFEGMKSVGQDDENGHNIEIISTNSDKTESNKIKISLSEPLRSLPNEAKDRIIKINGQWYIERNCGEILLEGDEQWTLHNRIKEDTVLFYSPFNAEHTSNNSFGATREIISDKFNYLDSHWEHRPDDIEGAYTSFNGYICIAIKKSKLNTPDAVGFKEWLKNNPTRLVYKLSTPAYELIDFNSLQLYLDTTHISNNSTIPANLKVTVDRTINRATEAIELAKINPTIANLSRARYWTNLLKESTKKDELQEEINNNVDVVDLQLERKMTSANLDVYIKCENMLSMSLDTNQISFDDFSGIEDVEKLNAVNVTINSSLPYQLNAYLPAEIQNTDKTKTMNKEILQLKESNESDYKEFANINEKVVLKDNCSSGNQLVHGIDIMLRGGIAHEKDVYKAVIKLEAEQK